MEDIADSCFRAHPAAVDEYDKSGLIVWRADGGDVIAFNKSGAEIWRRLRLSGSPRQIAADLTQRAGREEPHVLNDVGNLIRILHHAGLVEEVTPVLTLDSELTEPTPRDKALALRFIGDALSPERSIVVPGAIGNGFWESVARFAFRYRVSGLLQNQIEQKGAAKLLPLWLGEHLASLREINRKQNRTIREQLSEAVAALNRKGIEPLLLKGAAMLLAGTYFGDGDRWMSDIDMALKAEDLERGLNTLSALGYGHTGNTRLDYGSHHHLAPLVRSATEAPIEIHRSLLHRNFSKVLPTGDAWNQSIRLEYPGTRFRVPSPRHRVVHAVAHALLVDRHFARGTLPLRELCDYAWLMQRHGSSMRYEPLANAFSTRLPVLGSFLHAAERLLGVPAPQGCNKPVFVSRLYWWRVTGGLKWSRLQTMNERFYRLSSDYLYTSGRCSRRNGSLWRARFAHIGDWIVRRLPRTAPLLRSRNPG